MGAVSPCGLDVASSWEAIINGKSGIAPITHFDAAEYAVRIAGEVKDFVPENYIEKKRVREADTFIHYAIAAPTKQSSPRGMSRRTSRKRWLAPSLALAWVAFPCWRRWDERWSKRGRARSLPISSQQ
jgi:3-oxoacyl-(acyl-carrier-protein) synthase